METSKNPVELNWVNQLYQELTDQLSEIKEEAHLKRLAIAIQTTKAFIAQLRQYILARKFTNHQEMITFFKQLKPKYYGHLFYYANLYHIELRRPLAGPQLREYYLLQLQTIQTTFERNREFYVYLLSDASYLDKEFFVLGEQKAFSGHYFTDIDPEYATGYDYLVAQYWAEEKLADYLNRKLTDLDKPAVSFDLPKEAPKIVWTDSKTALIELIYAFKAKGSFNQGTATLKDITDYVQQAFSVELNNPSRDFQEILRRKMGYTIYLDGLKESYLRYIDAIENKARR